MSSVKHLYTFISIIWFDLSYKKPGKSTALNLYYGLRSTF